MDSRLPRAEARPQIGLPPAPPRPRQVNRRRRPPAGLLAGGLAFVIAFGLAREARALDRTAVASPPPMAGVSPEHAHHPREKTFLKRQWGVEVMDVRQTAAGHILELRYRVLDAEKAKPLFKRQTKPVLTHVESGARLLVPTPAKTGALRNSNAPIAGRTYWMFFANPGGMVRPGQHVNIEIGEFRVNGLVVHSGIP